MYIESLRYLLAIQQTGSLHKAAESLNTSCQNVSKVLKQMEKELNIPIFERTAQGVRPTKHTQAVLIFAQTTLENYDSLLTACSSTESQKNIKGTVTLSITRFTSNQLDDVLAEFIPQYPYIQLNFHEIKINTPATGNPNNISFLPDAAYLDNLGYEKKLPMIEDKIFALVKKNSPLGKQKSITLKKFSQQPTVVYSKYGYENSIYYYVLKDKVSLKYPPFITDDMRSYKLYIGSGEYIGLTTSQSYKYTISQSDNYTLLPIREPSIYVTSYLLIKDTKSLTEAEQLFIEFMQNYFLNKK